MRRRLLSVLTFSFLALGSFTANGDHLSLDHCAATDAKCVGKVLLTAISGIHAVGGGGKTTYCQCYLYQGGSWYLGLHRLADQVRLADLSGPHSSHIDCGTALEKHPSCR